MSIHPRRLAVPVVLLLLAMAFAGCISDSKKNEGFSIAREVALTMDRATMDAMDDNDTPEEAIRKLMTASLVVRVAEAGDYVLSYRDAAGVDQNVTLTGLNPGEPRTVPGAHPFSPVALLRGDEVMATRAATPREWWHVGDLPLGVLVESGASAEYATTATSRGEFHLEDLKRTEGDLTIDTMDATLDMPLEGTLRWSSQPEGSAGDRIGIEGTLQLGKPAGNLATFGMSGTMQGEPLSAGIVVPPFESSTSTGLSLFVKDGELEATRMDGGRASVSPVVSLWVEGGDYASALAQQCPNGATRADPCELSDISFDETFEAGEKMPVDASEFQVEDADDQKALDALRAFLSEDLIPGDTFTWNMRMDETDLDATGDLDAGFTFELAVVGIEKVDVPAGSFDAVKITETLRMRFAANGLRAAETSPPVLDGLSVDETAARVTVWLDASTFTPLKVVAESPLDVGALYREVLASVTDQTWTDAGMERPPADAVRISFDGRATMEATRLQGTNAFAPYVGLLLANGMAQGVTLISTMGLGTMGTGYGETAAAMPAHSLALVSQGAFTDGIKAYTIASASPNMTWMDLAISVDGVMLYQDETCEPTGVPSYSIQGQVCEDAYSMVDAGDVVTLDGVQQGQTLRILDMMSNSVILTLTIA